MHLQRMSAKTVMTRQSGGEWSIVGFHINREGAGDESSSGDADSDAGPPEHDGDQSGEGGDEVGADEDIDKGEAPRRIPGDRT